ncbi:hypothetical protein P3W45_001397 [Vairimorpha bombi]
MVGRRKTKNETEIKSEDTTNCTDTKINESLEKDTKKECENKTETTESKAETTESKAETTESKTNASESKAETTESKAETTESKTNAPESKTNAPESKTNASESKTNAPESGWDAPAAKAETAEGGWGSESKAETAEGGWGSESKAETTEGGWGSETASSAWDAPAPSVNVDTSAAVDGYNGNNDYRGRDSCRPYKPRGHGDSSRDEFPRKRFDRGEYDYPRSSGSNYGQEKRFRSDRNDQGDYRPREDSFRSRDREGGYRPREDSFRPRDREENYKPRDREDGYKPRDREDGYRPRDREDGYRPRDREGGYERSNGNRGAPSTYDPMSENGQQSYERRPKKVIPENVPPSKALGLFGLSLYATEDDLREFLAEELPEIRDFKLTIITDHETKKSRGFGFVYFQCLEDSIKAKECLTGKAIKGKEIRVDFSVSDVLRPNYR